MILNRNKSSEITERSFTEVNSAVDKKTPEKSKKPVTTTNFKDQSNKPNWNSEKIIPSDQTDEENGEYNWMLICHDGKLCPLMSLIVNRKKLERTIKAAIESALNHKLSEILSDETTQRKLNRTIKGNEVSAGTNSPHKSQKSPQYSENVSSHDECSNSESDTKSESSKASDKKGNDTDINPDDSVFIKSTDLSERSDQHSRSTLSCKGNEEENELLKWKRNCEEGIFTLKNLVDQCEKDPDAVLATFKLNKDPEKMLPDAEAVNNRKEQSLLEKTHGKKFGDPKYHLLMKDASTSFHKHKVFIYLCYRIDTSSHFVY